MHQRGAGHGNHDDDGRCNDHAAAALITGFVAKEVVVGSFAQSYSVDEPGDPAHAGSSCPDGTEVAVWGIVRRSGDGSTMLCDDATATACLKVDAGASIESPGDIGGKVFFTGVVSEGVLTTPRSPVLAHP